MTSLPACSQTGAVKKVNAGKKRRVKKTTAGRGAIVLSLLFVMLSSILVVQRNAINNLDSQIRSLESEYSQAAQLNDDLSGQLMQAQNIKDIESYALNKLGMIKATKKHYTYVSYNDTQTDRTNDNAYEEGGILGFLKSILE